MLKEWSETEVSGKASIALAQASTIDEVEAALERRRSPLTPHRVGLGGLYLQPTDERPGESCWEYADRMLASAEAALAVANDKVSVLRVVVGRRIGIEGGAT